MSSASVRWYALPPRRSSSPAPAPAVGVNGALTRVTCPSRSTVRFGRPGQVPRNREIEECGQGVAEHLECLVAQALPVGVGLDVVGAVEQLAVDEAHRFCEGDGAVALTRGVGCALDGCLELPGGR